MVNDLLRLMRNIKLINKKNLNKVNNELIQAYNVILVGYIWYFYAAVSLL